MPASAPRDQGAFCVVMHDVSPATWQASQFLLDALAEVGPFRTTWLVVPQYHTGIHARNDRNFCALLSGRVACGDELVLHGLTHRDDAPVSSPWQFGKRRFYTSGEGEFAALGEAEALRRLQSGIDWFAAENWPLKGFVAPAWLMSAGTWKALSRTSLSYTTTLGGLHLLNQREAVASQSLVFSSRSAWRRGVSHLFADALARRLERAPVVRLGLHPADAAYPQIVRHWQRLFEHFSARRRSLTKAAYVEEHLARARVQQPARPVAA